jgi:AraC-like DNA-binding protein
MYFHVSPSDPAMAVGGARIAAYLPLPAILEEFDVALPDVLRAVGLPPDVFDDPDNVVPYPAAAGLLQVSAEMTGCDHLGLMVGQRSGLASLGLAGQAALCAESVGDGLANLAESFSSHNTAAIVSLITDGDFSRLVYSITATGMGDTRQLQQGAMALASNVMRALCGPQWVPTVVTFASRAPANLREWQKCFRAKLCFDSAESSLVFESRWLDQPLPARDDDRQFEKLLHPRPALLANADPFSTNLRHVVQRQLLVGHLSKDRVAAALGLQPRTLGRRLAHHGTTYNEVVELAKRDAACQLLRDTRLPIQEISDFLQYSSAANFSTAFRRWTGITPRAFRGQAR